MLARRCADIFDTFDEDGNARLDELEVLELLEGLKENKSSLFEGNHVSTLCVTGGTVVHTLVHVLAPLFWHFVAVGFSITSCL